MRKLYAGLFVAAAWSIAPQFGLAQEPSLFDRLDANKDGFVTPDEAGDEKKRLFEQLLRSGDKNGDGKLSREEFAEGLKPRAEEPRRDEPRRDDRPAGGPNVQQLFERFDKNGDGKISKEEAPPQLENFDRIDANKDGSLDKAELVKAFGQREGGRPDGARPEGREREGLVQMFKQQDKNGDGKLTADEVPDDKRDTFKEMLKRLGKGEDGGINLDQFVTFLSQRRGEPDRRPEPGARPDGAPPRFEGVPGGPLMRILDTNNDGQLSAEEIAGASKSLAALDKNGDGRLSRDELLPPPPPGSATRGDFNPQAMLERLRGADKNGDGKFSKEELADFPGLRARFDDLDGNKDGFVDTAELKPFLSRQPDRPAGDRRPEGDRRPDGERRPEGERKPDGERRREGDRKPEGDRRPEGDRKPEG